MFIPKFPFQGNLYSDSDNEKYIPSETSREKYNLKSFQIFSLIYVDFPVEFNKLVHSQIAKNSLNLNDVGFYII